MSTISSSSTGTLRRIVSDTCSSRFQLVSFRFCREQLLDLSFQFVSHLSQGEVQVPPLESA